MSKPVVVNSALELDLILGKNPKVLVDFSRHDGCIWCDKLTPHFNVASDLSPDTKFVIAYVDLIPDLIEQHGIMSVPYLILFEDGVAVTEIRARTALQIVSAVKR